MRDHSIQPLPIEIDMAEETKRRIRESAIHFVMPDGVRKETMSYSMILAHDAIRKCRAHIDINMIRFIRHSVLLSSLINCPEEVTGTFVMETLSGPVYDRLLKKSQTEKYCRIFGPIAVAQAFARNPPDLPLTKGIPLVNIGLRNVIVGVSSSCHDRINEFKNKLLPLGVAAVTKKIVKNLQVVISCNVTDKMCEAARTHGIPIVDPKWVLCCYQKKDEPELCLKTSKINENRIQIFKGMVFSMSQIDQKKKDKLEKLAEKHGFTYQGNMKKGETTHLICEKPEGLKFTSARIWGIFIVKLQWFIDSIQKGSPLIEKGRYLVVPNNPDSSHVTQFEDDMDDDVEIESTPPVFSTQTVCRLRRDSSLHQSYSRAHSPDFVDRSLIETRRTGCSQETGRMSIRDPDEEEDMSFKKRTQSQQQVSQTPTVTSRLETLVGLQENTLLDGYTIFICPKGFNDKIRRLIKRVVSNCQGHISSDISDDVLICLVPSREPTEDTKKLLTDIRISGSNAQVTDIEWLLQTLEGGMLLNAGTFDVQMPESSQNISSAEIPNTLFGFNMQVRKKIPVSQKRPVFHDDEEVIQDENPRMEDLLDEYRAGSTQTTGSLRITQKSQQKGHPTDKEYDDDDDVYIGDIHMSTQPQILDFLNNIYPEAASPATQVTQGSTQGVEPMMVDESSQVAQVPEVVYGIQAETAAIQAADAKEKRDKLNILLERKRPNRRRY